MDTDLSKLEQYTKRVMEIMLLAQSSFKIVDYLTRERSGEEIAIIAQNHYFHFAAEISWRTYVTEMAKLFSPNSKTHTYNLQKLINKFKSDAEFRRLKGIDDRSILIWEQNLAMEKIKIDNLLLQRNKVYSHTDKDGPSVKNILTHPDAAELLDVVKRIISEIHIAVIGKSYAYFLLQEPVLELKRLVRDLVTKRHYDQYFLSEHCKENGIDPRELGLPG
jgi:AbiU2